MQQQSTHDSPLPHVVPTPHPFVSSAPHIFSSFLWLNWSNRQISCNWVGKGELDQISCALFSLSFFPTFKLSLPFSCFSIHFSYLDQLATATSWENEDIRLNSSQDCVCLLPVVHLLLVAHISLPSCNCRSNTILWGCFCLHPTTIWRQTMDA